MSMNWHQMRKPQQDGEQSMYLCASFNHWFPIKMEPKEEPQVEAPNGAQRQNSKHSSESMKSDEEVDDSPTILFNAGIASSNRKNDYLKL